MNAPAVTDRAMVTVVFGSESDARLSHVVAARTGVATAMLAAKIARGSARMRAIRNIRIPSFKIDAILLGRDTPA